MKTHILRSLSGESFRYLWLSELFTQVAVNVFNFFLILVAFSNTRSNTAVSGVVLSFTIPAIIFGSVAGAYVDRWNKRKVLLISNTVQAGLLLLLIFFLKSVFMLYLISFVFATLRQFFIPAETPLIPMIVEKANLLSANALFGLGIYGSILFAYIISGALFIFLGNANTLVVLSVLLLISTFFIFRIKLTPVKVRKYKFGDGTVNLFSDIRHTLGLIKRTREISDSLFLLALSQILILIIATLAPGYARQILGVNINTFPLLFAAPAALGTVFGTVILVNIFHSHPRDKVINFGIFLSGLAILLLPYGSKVSSREFVSVLNSFLPHFLNITIIHIMFIVAFILGIANAFVFVPANTIIQEKTTDEFRGKIYGFLNSLVGTLSLLPIIIAGGLSDLIGVGSVITGIGISVIVLGAFRLMLYLVK